MDRRVLLPLLLLSGLMALGLATRRGSALAHCDVGPKTQEQQSTPSSRSEPAQCAEAVASQSAVGNGSSRRATALGESATESELSPADPLFALRRAILNGSSLPQVGLPLNLKNHSFRWPMVGPITQPFGVPELGVGLPHAGLDIGQDAGNPVRVAESGRVVFSGGDPCCGLGYWIEVNHGDGYSTRYGHLLRPPIFLRGDYVTQGQVLGFSGNTGFSTGPHLHFEFAVNGIPIDPLRVLPSR